MYSLLFTRTAKLCSLPITRTETSTSWCAPNRLGYASFGLHMWGAMLQMPRPPRRHLASTSCSPEHALFQVPLPACHQPPPRSCSHGAMPQPPAPPIAAKHPSSSRQGPYTNNIATIFSTAVAPTHTWPHTETIATRMIHYEFFPPHTKVSQGCEQRTYSCIFVVS